jgi:hypothetical protein
MTDRFHTRAAVAWTKQRLDELDEVLFEADKAVDSLKDSARENGERELERLRRCRDKLRKLHGRLRTEAETAQRGAEEIVDAFETEWMEVEAALQSFLSVNTERDVWRRVVGVRAQAQRQAWEASVEDLRHWAAEVVDKTRGEFEEAIKRLSDETEKLQNRIGVARDAGDQSQEAVKSGLAAAKAAYERTTQRIKEALPKLL